MGAADLVKPSPEAPPVPPPSGAGQQWVGVFFVADSVRTVSHL